MLNPLLSGFSCHLQLPGGYHSVWKTVASQTAHWARHHAGTSTTDLTEGDWTPRGRAGTEGRGCHVLTIANNGFRLTSAPELRCMASPRKEGKMLDSGWRPTRLCTAGAVWGGLGTKCDVELWWVKFGFKCEIRDDVSSEKYCQIWRSICFRKFTCRSDFAVNFLIWNHAISLPKIFGLSSTFWLTDSWYFGCHIVSRFKRGRGRKNFLPLPLPSHEKSVAVKFQISLRQINLHRRIRVIGLTTT